MEKSELGLNEHHQNIVVNYLRFAKYQRGQHLKSVQQSFDNIKLSRLLDDTYTVNEVKELLDELCSLLMGDLESDLINTAHTVILLLVQMCSQAERYYLKLQADISELENRELLEKVNKFNRKLSSNNIDKCSPGSPLKMNKLEPLTDESGSHKLLHMEIERQKLENQKLLDRLKEVENKALQAMQQKSALSEELCVTRTEVEELKGKELEDAEEMLSDIRQKLFQIEEKKAKLEDELQERMLFQSDLEKNLAEKNQQLLEAQAHFQLVEKELELKFSQTTTYQNMKQMLAAKNEQIKSLRKKIQEDDPVEEQE